MKNKKRVAIYTRVSTNDQNLDIQINDLKDYAQKREWEIFNIYQEKVSGSGKNRPAFNEMIKASKKRKFDIVLVWKFDRFARSLKMLVDSLGLFESLGIDFVSYKENLDTTTPMGKLMYHINSAYAEFEKEIIRERVKAGVQRKMEKTGGKWGREKLPKEKQEEIKQLRAKGVSIRKTAEQVGVSAKTVVKYC